MIIKRLLTILLSTCLLFRKKNKNAEIEKIEKYMVVFFMYGLCDYITTTTKLKISQYYVYSVI